MREQDFWLLTLFSHNCLLLLVKEKQNIILCGQSFTMLECSLNFRTFVAYKLLIFEGYSFFSRLIAVEHYQLVYSSSSSSSSCERMINYSKYSQSEIDAQTYIVSLIKAPLRFQSKVENRRWRTDVGETRKGIFLHKIMRFYT